MSLTQEFEKKMILITDMEHGEMDGRKTVREGNTYGVESIDTDTAVFTIDGVEVTSFKKEMLLNLSRMFIQMYSEGF